MKVRRSSHIYGHLIAALLSVHKMEFKKPQTVSNGTKDPIKATQYVINTKFHKGL